jgi:hypothetical protein
MDEKEVKELILRKQVNGTISCTAAFQIAKEAGASTGTIGRLLNEMEIKIRACQLGCFK